MVEIVSRLNRRRRVIYGICCFGEYVSVKEIQSRLKGLEEAGFGGRWFVQMG
jgi:hypothetical protein